MSLGELELSVLLVNWNTRELTLDCLRSVYAETHAVDFEVIVIDNASSDGSVEAIRQEFPQVRLLEESENHGFARATNIQAKQAKGRKLLLLNTDTIVLDRAIDSLFAFATANPAARIWGGRTLFGDRTLNPTSCWGRYTTWNLMTWASGLSALAPGSKLLNPRAYPGWDRDTPRQVDIVTGCLLMIDRDFWEELGGFDPEFFMYGEEADLCMRAQVRGAQPMITPQATVVHLEGGSTKSNREKTERTFAAVNGMVQRHFPKSQKALGTNILKLAAGTRAGLFSLAEKIGGARFSDKAELWRSVWSRREEWSSTDFRRTGGS